MASTCPGRLSTPSSSLLNPFSTSASRTLPPRSPSTRPPLTSSFCSPISSARTSRHLIIMRVYFKRLVDNMECSEPGVVSAMVGVLCELATKDHRLYLPLAPEFYKILVDPINNWLLIKVLKIFAKLAPLEPRLAKRLVDPICGHLRRTKAKSLVFECIRTIMSSLNEFECALNLSIEKLADFMTDDDPNLKYLGLQALATLVPQHSWAVSENKEFVIKSLNDIDVNIKLEALRLVMTMVSQDNVVEICRVLINYALKSDPEFCNEILGSILSMCSRNIYEIILDFDWYVSLLGEMARLPHCHKGGEIENQLVDISMRVRDARPQLVRVGRDLLIDPALLENHFVHHILSAAAWMSGEYIQFSKNPHELLEALLQPRTSLLPPSIRAVYIQSILKVLSFCTGRYLCSDQTSTAGVTHSTLHKAEYCDLRISASPTGSETDDGINPGTSHQPAGDMFMVNSVGHEQMTFTEILKAGSFAEKSIINLLNLVEEGLCPLVGSHEVDIQESARNVIGLIELLQEEYPAFFSRKECDDEIGEMKACEIIKLMSGAFLEELVPVSVVSQERVPLPDALVLNENLKDLDTICGGDVMLPMSGPFSLGRPNLVEKNESQVLDCQDDEEYEPTNQSKSLLAEHRKRHGLYYLTSQTTPGDDYPPANDPTMGVTGKTEELIKLTEQSFLPNRKGNKAKSRPVVVRLDDVDGILVPSKKHESKEDLLSGAVQEVLKGNDDFKASTSRSKPAKLSSNKRKDKNRSSRDKPSEVVDSSANIKTKENLDLGKSKRCLGHRQEGKNKNPVKAKSRHTTNMATSVEAQSSVITDYLL
ncbi:hypothetical protein DM860_017131 [Cuscuta australis]|uniref:Clathrin/coatomer adaptor adaptin-like N-terminal domain-containing protein n=1 Tax=Cuscuta australis TaxID=267555 RepID=A0A328DAS8_9ASTE|nr:hypothetical protein DM860_017131 [Cuscuta australis]